MGSPIGSHKKTAWIHAVSVGEVNLIASLITSLEHRLPDWDFVISTTTRTGMQLAQQKHPELTKFYFPIDFSWAVRSALRRVQPDMIILAELELWPNLIAQCHHAQIPITIVNGRLSSKSYHGYQRFKFLVKPMFEKLSLVTAQTETYRKRFVDLGTPALHSFVTGSIKFDGACTPSNQPQQDSLKRQAGISDQDTVWVAGSTQAPEEEMVANIYQKLKRKHTSLRLVIVPRHIERSSAIAQMLAERGTDVMRRSEFGNRQATSDTVILVDTIGELASWWHVGQIAFVGGSFGNRGGQNMLEPAFAAAAVCFGPNTWNFNEIVQQLLVADAVCQLPNQTALESFIEQCLAQPTWSAQLGKKAKQCVLDHQGASDQIAQLLAALVSKYATPDDFTTTVAA